MRSPSRLALPAVAPLESTPAGPGAGKEWPTLATKLDNASSFGLKAKRTLHQTRWSGSSSLSTSTTSDPTTSWLGGVPLGASDDEDDALSLEAHNSFFAASDSGVNLGEGSVARSVLHAWSTLPDPEQAAAGQQPQPQQDASDPSGGAAAAGTSQQHQQQHRQQLSATTLDRTLSASLSSFVPAGPPPSAAPQPVAAESPLDEQRLAMLRSLRDQAHAKLRQGDFACAVALLDAADALHPHDAWTLKHRGSAKCGLEQLLQALADLDRADALAPNDAFTLRQRGEVKRGLGRYAEAVADLSRADALQPHHAWTLKRRGAALRCLGRLAEAVSDLDQACALEPHDAFTLRQRGAAKCGLGLYSGALRDLNEADRLRPNDAFTLRQRGEVHRCMVQLSAALADLDRAHALEPRDAFTLRQRAWVHLKLGTDHLDAVLADLYEADRLEPNHPHTLKLRGVALYKRQRPREALEDIQRAMELGLATDAELVRYKRKAELQLAMALALPDGLLRALAPPLQGAAESLAKVARLGSASSSSPRGSAGQGGRQASF